MTRVQYRGWLSLWRLAGVQYITYTKSPIWGLPRLCSYEEEAVSWESSIRPSCRPRGKEQLLPTPATNLRLSVQPQNIVSIFFVLCLDNWLGLQSQNIELRGQFFRPILNLLISVKNCFVRIKDFFAINDNSFYLQLELFMSVINVLSCVLPCKNKIFFV
jgi:hypothetical protein